MKNEVRRQARFHIRMTEQRVHNVLTTVDLGMYMKNVGEIMPLWQLTPKWFLVTTTFVLFLSIFQMI